MATEEESDACAALIVGAALIEEEARSLACSDTDKHQPWRKYIIPTLLQLEW